MTCKEAELQIALWVEGDAPEPAHLAGCEPCRRLAGELRESQAALKDLAEEEFDPALLDAVRARVMARVAEQRRAFQWWWLPAAAALAAALFVALAVRPAPLPAPLPRVVAAIPPAPPAAKTKPLPQRRRSVTQHARSKSPAPPLMMKIVTDDPDVVIYWFIDLKEKGD